MPDPSPQTSPAGVARPVERAEVVVIGGGNAGISLAARMLRKGADDVLVIEPSPTHRYRPLLNYVGAGEAAPAALERPMASVIPPGCRWVKDAVDAVDPATSTVTTRRGRSFRYSTLVVCPGMVEDWDATPGLLQAYTAGWAGSTYVPTSAPLVWPALKRVTGGSVLFTVPPEPAPCGATALKPLLMACDTWQRSGRLADIDVTLVLPDADALGVPDADEHLEAVFASYGIRVLRQARVTRVDPVIHSVDVDTPAARHRLDDVAYAHVVPHYRAPRWVGASGLAGPGRAGLVDIDPQTLRSRHHENLWAIGDAASIATRSSGGALRKQVKVLTHNIDAAAKGKKLTAYDGLTVMPVTTSRHRLMLVEADRQGRRPRHAPIDPFKPRWATWVFDRYGLPQVYFHRILKGR